MESKYVKVSAKKVEKTIDFYASFGWTLAQDKEELPNGKVGLTFERDKKRLAEAYGVVKKGERLYAKVSRPYPLGALISIGIGCAFLVLYFLMRSFAYYILFLYGALTFYAVAVYLLIVFLVIFLHRFFLLKKIIYSVGLEAGTLRDFPLKNNILEEDEDTWAIADNL